jgi:hypothetical protein
LLADKEQEEEKAEGVEALQAVSEKRGGLEDAASSKRDVAQLLVGSDPNSRHSSSEEDSSHAKNDDTPTMVLRRQHASPCKKAPIETPDPRTFGTWLSIMVKTSRVGQVAKRGLEHIKQDMESLFEDGADDVLYFRILADALVCWIGEEKECLKLIKTAKGAGMIDLIMKYLSRAKGDPVSQKWGLRAMRYLTYNGYDDSVQPTENKEGIFRFVRRRLEVYRDAWDVQHWGIRVLCNLTYKNSQIARFIVENGVLDDVSEALDNHQTNCTVQRWCMQILCNVSVCSRIDAQITEKHLSKILFALHKHEGNSAVQFHVMGVLHNIMMTHGGSFCSKHQNEVLKAGAVPLILKGLTNFGSIPGVQHRCIMTIRNLITGNRAASQRVGEEGGISDLLAAMSNQFDVIEIQKQGIITLQELAVDPMNQGRFRSLRGTLEKLENKYYQLSAREPNLRERQCHVVQRQSHKYKLLANALRRELQFAFETPSHPT